MKNTMKSALSLLLVIFCTLTLAGCKSTPEPSALWENALYTEDTTFGDGGTTVEVQVKVIDKTVTFTINTDKTTVGAALLEHGLIAGDEGQFGLYLKVVNGITADYDIDQSYWAFYINGEYAMTGVDTTEITAGTTYLLEYTK